MRRTPRWLTTPPRRRARFISFQLGLALGAEKRVLDDEITTTVVWRPWPLAAHYLAIAVRVTTTTMTNTDHSKCDSHLHAEVVKPVGILSEELVQLGQLIRSVLRRRVVPPNGTRLLLRWLAMYRGLRLGDRILLAELQVLYHPVQSVLLCSGRRVRWLKLRIFE